jgi:tetratricopeptide (TPR) repeat protein
MSILGWWRADRAYSRAWRLARAGQAAEAAKRFDETAGVFGARALIQKARVLNAAGRSAEAVKAAREATTRGQSSHAAWLTLGQTLYDAGNLAEARRAFEKARELDPDNQLVQAYLGLTRIAQGQFDQGLELLRPNLLYGYDRLEARVLVLAEQYLWENRERARPLEEQLTPDEGGRDSAPVGLWVRASSLLRRALLGPLARLRGPYTYQTFLAQEAMSVGDAEAALAALKAAEQAGAHPHEVALGLAQAYYEARKPAAAAEHLARLPEEMRHEPEAASLYGGALYEAGRYDEARDYLAIAAARYRQEFVPAYYRGMCEIALGRPREAVKWFEDTAARLNPHVAEKRLGEWVRVRSGRPTES